RRCHRYRRAAARGIRRRAGGSYFARWRGRDAENRRKLYWRRAKERQGLSPWSDNKKRPCQKPRRSAWRERSDSRPGPDRWQQFRKSLRDTKFPPAAPPEEK